MTNQNPLALAQAIRAGDCTVAEAVTPYIEKIQQDGSLFSSFDREAIAEQMDAVQARLVRERPSPLGWGAGSGHRNHLHPRGGNRRRFQDADRLSAAL